MQILKLIALLCLLTACGGFSAAKVDVPPPSEILTQPCEDLQANPGRALTQAEAEILWGRDRSAARACSARHAALVEWVLEMITELGG